MILSNFSNEQAGNVIESIPNFELELELYLKKQLQLILYKMG